MKTLEQQVAEQWLGSLVSGNGTTSQIGQAVEFVLGDEPCRLESGNTGFGGHIDATGTSSVLTFSRDRDSTDGESFMKVTLSTKQAERAEKINQSVNCATKFGCLKLPKSWKPA